MTITSSQTGGFTSAPFLLHRRSRFVQCAIQNYDARIALSQLHAAEIGLMNLRQMGKFLLGDAPPAARLPEIEPDPDAHIHVCIGEGWLLPNHRL